MNQPPKQRVLVVDDDPSVRAMMQMALTDAGFDAQTADGVAAAKRLLTDHPWCPEAVVIDLMMQPQDGSQLAAWLRRTYPKTRIVIYSAWPEAEAIKIVQGEMQADAFVSKPAGMVELIAAIEAV